MGIIKFIFYIGIINIVFSFIWKWIFVVPAAIFFTLINFDKGMIIVKVFGAYLLISLLAILSLGFIEENIIDDKLYLIIVGSFMIYMILSNTFYEARKKALIEYALGLQKPIRPLKPFMPEYIKNLLSTKEGRERFARESLDLFGQEVETYDY